MVVVCISKKGKSYDFKFNAVDPNEDSVRYIIDWGDNTTNITDFYSSGTDVIVSHTWVEEGIYTITAIAEDEFCLSGYDNTLEINIPRSRASVRSLFYWFLERFPMLERLLSLIRVG